MSVSNEHNKRALGYVPEPGETTGKISPGLAQRFASFVADLFPGQSGLNVLAGGGALMGLAAAAGATSTYVMVNKAHENKNVINKTLLSAAAAGTGVLALDGAVQAYDLIQPKLSCFHPLQQGDYE
jgi:hypothetical protein